MGTKTINISLPYRLVDILDKQAIRSFSTRSDYIKRAIISQLEKDGALRNYEDTYHIPSVEEQEKQLKDLKRAQMRRAFLNPTSVQEDTFRL